MLKHPKTNTSVDGLHKMHPLPGKREETEKNMALKARFQKLRVGAYCQWGAEKT